jgi:hypothetical protein
MEPYYNHLNKKLDQLHQRLRPTRPNKERTKETGHPFYHRMENLTNVKFTTEEMKILNYGPQYSIEKTDIIIPTHPSRRNRKSHQTIGRKNTRPIPILSRQKPEANHQ